MKWKVLLVVGAVAVGVVLASRRRNAQRQADAELWAEATDSVPRSRVG